MRISTLAGLAAFACFAAASAQATPVTWTLNGTVDHTNYPALGPIELGDAFSATMTLETDTPSADLHIDGAYAYYNLFDSFSVSIGGKVLTLGPKTDDLGWTREANWLGSSNYDDYQTVQLAAMVYDGADAYQAYLWFDLADTAAFPMGSLPGTPPSLASATFRDFSLYSPVDGDPRNGAIFVAGGDVDSFTAVRSVPEPSELALMLTALAMLALRFRRRVSGASAIRT